MMPRSSSKVPDSGSGRILTKGCPSISLLCAQLAQFTSHRGPTIHLASAVELEWIPPRPAGVSEKPGIETGRRACLDRVCNPSHLSSSQDADPTLAA